MNCKPVTTTLFKRYSFEHLLLWFMLYLLAGPFFINFAHAREILSALMTGVLFAAAYTLSKHHKLFNRASGSLLFITLILLWGGSFDLISFSATSGLFLLAIYLCLISYTFIRHIVETTCINTSLISATLCLYLILGLLWGTLFALLENLSPGSFSNPVVSSHLGGADHIHYFMYFSFVTLTTLGYGDILPLTAGARALCQTEAILGQFFMAVTVARLVGIQVAQQFSAPDRRKGPHD